METPTITSNLSIDPTFEEIKKPTNPVTELNAQTENETTAQEEPLSNPDDFSKKEEAATITESVQEEQIPTRGRQKLCAKTSAALIVSAEDNLQQLILPRLYQNAIFTSEERRRIRQLKTEKIANSDIEFSNPVDVELLERYNEFKDLKNLLPFDESEKNTLIECWELIIKDNPRMALSPISALILAHAQIMGMRLIPILSKFA